MGWDLADVSRKRLAAIAGGGVILALVVWAVGGWIGPGDEDGPAGDEATVVRLEEQRDLDGLAAAAGGPDERAARRAVRALGAIGGADAAGRLRPALRDPRPGVRHAAALHTGQIGPAAGAESLSHVRSMATADAAPEVRAAAAVATGKLLAGPGQPPLTVAALEPLLKGLEDPDAAVRRSAVTSLQDLLVIRFSTYDPDAAPELRQKGVADVRAVVPLNVKYYNRWQDDLRTGKRKAGE